jgi:hypothetical protein
LPWRLAPEQGTGPDGGNRTTKLRLLARLPPQVSAAVIHNYYPEPVDTPEHNQMQVKFINQNHALKLAYLNSLLKLFDFNNAHFKVHLVKFIDELSETRVDLNIILSSFERMNGMQLLNISDILFEEKGVDVQFTVEYGYKEFGIPENVFYQASNVFNNFWRESSCKVDMKVEIKPAIGDDFPSVLRQIKKSGSNTLLIKEYTGTGATFEEFRKFFISQKLRVFEEQFVEEIILPSYDEVFVFDDESRNYIINKIKGQQND